MATNIETIQFLTDQLSELKNVTAKKMFGEYLIYYNEKPVLLICDDTVFVKIIPASTAVLGENNPKGFPYKGAKEHFVVQDPENKETLVKLVQEIEKVTAVPKKKKK